MEFEFATADRIIFGPGKLNQIGSYAGELGKKALVVIGIELSKAAIFLEILDEVGIDSEIFSIDQEPTIEIIREGMYLARTANCDMVISFGGGSAIDCGKAISVLLTNTGDILEYLEVIGKGKPILSHPVTFIAIPTTAGTGAEVTSNAVINSPVHKVKVSLRSPKMLPDIALIDPELTFSMPPEITGFTGMDALTQVIEPYVSKKSNPFTDSICREGMRRASNSLLLAYFNGDNLTARTDMSITSMFGGLALANSKLGAVHGIAGPFGGMFHAAHGAICARLLPYVMQENIHALQNREPQNEARYKYDEIARLLTSNSNATAMDGVDWIFELINSLKIPPLSIYGFSESELPGMIKKAKNASSMKGNPIQLTDEELENILTKAK